MPRMYNPEKLKIDCENCDALCCAAFRLPYPDNPKKAGDTCKNLDVAIRRCTIFNELEARGYQSCRNYDCRGVGPAVTKLFRSLGRSWLTDPTVRNVQFHTMTVAYYEVLRYVYPDRMKGHLDMPADLRAQIQPFVDATLDLMSVEVPEIPDQDDAPRFRQE